MDRRQFLSATAGAACASLLPDATSKARPTPPLKYNFVRRDFARSRSPLRAVNWYTKIRPVKKSRGLFLQIHGEDPDRPRIRDADLPEYSWTSPGAPSNDNLEAFGWEDYCCRRHGTRNANQVQAVHDCLDARSHRIQRFMANPNNWPASRIVKFDGRMTKAIAEAAYERIHRETFGNVAPEDLVWVGNHHVGGAGAAACTQVAYPRGFLPNGDVLLLARPGELVIEGINGPNFATVTCFFLEEAVVEAVSDGTFRVIDDFDIQLTAPISGLYFKAS